MIYMCVCVSVCVCVVVCIALKESVTMYFVLGGASYVNQTDFKLMMMFLLPEFRNDWHPDTYITHSHKRIY